MAISSIVRIYFRVAINIYFVCKKQRFCLRNCGKCHYLIWHFNDGNNPQINSWTIFIYWTKELTFDLAPETAITSNTILYMHTLCLHASSGSANKYCKSKLSAMLLQLLMTLQEGWIIIGLRKQREELRGVCWVNLTKYIFYQMVKRLWGN